ncbi:MAG: hypothetical protein EBR54_02440 [Flavobacteriia bacterium]|nr:hypothetical protein [Flavobacteriia bacterium]
MGFSLYRFLRDYASRFPCEWFIPSIEPTRLCRAMGFSLYRFCENIRNAFKVKNPSRCAIWVLFVTPEGF